MTTASRVRLTAISLVAFSILPSAAVAATVSCNVHASLGYYKVELFREGDPYPYRQNYDVKIDGGKLITYKNIPTGKWFVRATLQYDPYLTGQGPSGHVTGYFPWTQTIPDCWVNP